MNDSVRHELRTTYTTNDILLLYAHRAVDKLYKLQYYENVDVSECLLTVNGVNLIYHTLNMDAGAVCDWVDVLGCKVRDVVRIIVHSAIQTGMWLLALQVHPVIPVYNPSLARLVDILNL